MTTAAQTHYFIFIMNYSDYLELFENPNFSIHGLWHLSLEKQLVREDFIAVAPLLKHLQFSLLLIVLILKYEQ